VPIRKSSISRDKYYQNHHRFEHWYVDNCVYFITSRCRNKFPAFESEAAKQIFWKKFEQYTSEFDFVPWITTLMHNHYHTVGYLKKGENLREMMRLLHGSVSKLVNDTLAQRLRPFWYDSGKQGYFDGCLRDEIQADRTYRYIRRQGIRHLGAKGIHYPHTRINIDKDRAIRRALGLNAFLRGVPYKRYEK